jgi:hypothetical protein
MICNFSTSNLLTGGKRVNLLICDNVVFNIIIQKPNLKNERKISERERRHLRDRDGWAAGHGPAVLEG